MTNNTANINTIDTNNNTNEGPEELVVSANLTRDCGWGEWSWDRKVRFDVSQMTHQIARWGIVCYDMPNFTPRTRF